MNDPNVGGSRLRPYGPLGLSEMLDNGIFDYDSLLDLKYYFETMLDSARYLTDQGLFSHYQGWTLLEIEQGLVKIKSKLVN